MTRDNKPLFTIAKAASAERLVFGFASVSVLSKSGALLTDLHGDEIDPVELEKAAYGFMLDFGQSGAMHVGSDNGRVVESFVTSPEKLQAMGVPEEVAKSIGTRWWVGVKLTDDATFAKVQSGEFKMFSIYGTATRVPS